MTVTVKTPFLPSTSAYQPGVTWANSSIPLSGGLCRATLGTSLKDAVFADYWKQWKDMKIVRSAYHYMMNNLGSADQAKFFVNTVNAAGGFAAGDRPCLDMEDANPSVSAIVDWFYNVEVLTGISHKKMLLYSRASYLNPLSLAKLSDYQKQYLLEIPTWMAGYPNDPNPYTFSQLKSMYQADPLRYGTMVIAQYAASVVIPGIANTQAQGTECNTIDADYLAQWQADSGLSGTVTPPVVPPATTLPTITLNLSAPGYDNVTVVWPPKV